MSRHVASITLVFALAMLLLPTGPLAAQSSNDAARTLVGISFGLLPGGLLWEVKNQPIMPISAPPSKPGTTPPSYPPDIWDIQRELVTRRPVIQVHGTRFVNPHVAFTAEFAYLAIKTSDACTVIQHGDIDHPGDPALRAVCDSISATAQGAQGSATIQGGVLFRPLDHALLQPYIGALAGFASSSGSSAKLTSTYGYADGGPTIMAIYHDSKSSNFQPTWTLMAGFGTAATQGLQAHVELRESWIAQSIVTGASAGQGTETPILRTFNGFFSVLVGFDVVLVKQRGHRYWP